MVSNVKAYRPPKIGVQTLGDLLTITIQDICMRTGWVLKSFNTFFDYWVRSLPSSVRSGKMIPGWTIVFIQGIHGSNTPKIDNIRTERIKLDEFTRHLIGRHNPKKG